MGKGEFRKNLVVFLLLLFLSGFLFFADQKGWLAPVRGVVERPILAIEERIYSLNILISQYLNIFSYWRGGEKELMRLQAQVQKLAVDQSQLSACLEENEAMRRLLGAPLSPKWKFLPAKVVGVSEKMRIDKGEKDGVEEGMMVVSENILVGKIVSVEERSALVQLPPDVNSKIPVVVKKPASANLPAGKPGGLGVQARGLLEVQGGKLILDKILQSEDIRAGDLVFSGGEGWLPDLLIGQIEEVFGREAAIYKQARVAPLIDYGSLRIVFIIISN